MSMKKKHLNLLVDNELINKARNYGLNLSKFFENQLRGYFRYLEDKQNNFSPYIQESNRDLQVMESENNYNKNYNVGKDNNSSSWARGVAWYPCSFGSYRLEFKSQRAHQYIIYDKNIVLSQILN